MKHYLILASSLILACGGPAGPEPSSGSGGSSIDGSDIGDPVSSGGTGGSSMTTLSGGGANLSTGGELSTGGGMALDSDAASGGVTSASGSGGSDPEREALISAVTNFCSQECAAILDIGPCSDGNVKYVPDLGLGCSRNCERSYFTYPMECWTDLTTYFNCLLDRPGFFDVHCEGTERVRADTTHCLDELDVINSCLHPEM